MKNKHLLPIVLAAAMVLSGVFAPRFFLKQSEERLLHAAGGRDGKEIAIYQGQHGKNELAERIGLLSSVMSKQGDLDNLWGWNEARNPFDSELSMDEAIESSSCFCHALQTNGKDMVQFPERDSWKAPYEAYFTTDKENLALSFWFSPGNKDLVILDAVSGIPIIANLLIEPKDQCKIREMYGIAAKTYNMLYADILGHTFSEEAEVLAGSFPSPMAEGSTGPYVLIVNYYPEYHMIQIRLTVRIDNSDTTS